MYLILSTAVEYERYTHESYLNIIIIAVLGHNHLHRSEMPKSSKKRRQKAADFSVAFVQTCYTGPHQSDIESQTKTREG
jgi:hypothetical protein